MDAGYVLAILYMTSPPQAQITGPIAPSEQSCQAERSQAIAEWPSKHPGRPLPSLVCVKQGAEDDGE